LNRNNSRTAEPYITQKQAGEYLGVTDRTIREMIADGRLPAYRLGAKVIRLRRSDIDGAMRRGPIGGDL
jgi:excisionase family DNA binding protein